MRATINFYLTWKCNFTCAHCIHECGPQGNHMTLEQMEYGIDFAKWLLKQNVAIDVVGTTGGEATLHPQFWTDYMPRMVAFRMIDPLIPFELHTNASIPLEASEISKYPKFFSTVFVGHDMCHRQFAPMEKLHLQDYTDIGELVHLRQNDCVYGGTHTVYVRLKGRAAESLEKGRFIQLNVKEHPKLGCSWHMKQRGSDCLYFTFTPDHINHCGEKSHPLPPLPLNQGNIDEGQFHSYGMEYNKLLHAALDYGTKYSGKNCSQKCMVSFCAMSPTSLKV